MSTGIGVILRGLRRPAVFSTAQGASLRRDKYAAFSGAEGKWYEVVTKLQLIKAHAIKEREEQLM